VGRAYFRRRAEPDGSEGRQLRLRTADGYEIGAVFYAALRPRAPRRVALLQ
jgi:hypothetical protein